MLEFLGQHSEERTNKDGGVCEKVGESESMWILLVYESGQVGDKRTVFSLFLFDIMSRKGGVVCVFGL